MKALSASLCLMAGSMLATSLPAPALAQAEQEAFEPDIVVEGSRKQEEKKVQALARQVTGRLDPKRPVPRFHRKMCLVVAGINDALVDSFAARIIENAEMATVPVHKSECKPNALVIFTDNSRTDLEQMRKKNRWMFGNIGPSALKRMLTSRDEAFAWQSTLPMGLNGMAFDVENRELPENRSTVDGGGRLSNTIKIDVTGAVVVIDKNAIEGLTAVQLADYASLRLLAPTAEITETGEGMPGTIMTLFRDRATAPPELTPFDLAFLRGVYDIPPNAPSSTVYGQITRTMMRSSTP